MAERSSARIRPGTRREIGWVNAGIVRVLGLATGGRPPNVFTTSPATTASSGCEYEWGHHERLDELSLGVEPERPRGRLG